MVFESADSWPSYEGQEREVPPPVSSYGFQKLAVEYFAKAAFDQYGLPFTIVRPFNCVGTGERRALGDVEILSGNVSLAMSHVVPDLVQKVLKGQDPLHILGDGTQIRHYTYGADLAEGIVTAMEHPDALNEDFNLSTPSRPPCSSWPRPSGWPSRDPRSRSTGCPTHRSNTMSIGGFRPRTRPSGSSGSKPPPASRRSSQDVVPWIEKAVADGTI